MKPSYLLRFDDITPTMNWKVWDQVESIMNQYHLKPLLAVVPDNQDPELNIEPPRDDFWEKVRAWQAAGWTIALHGYQHHYTSKSSGLTGINSYSEFAGLPYEEQYEKIRRGVEIFKQNGVRADAWIAPAHSFDEATVKALLENGIHIISDGYYLRPVKRMGATWIPQQLWHLRPMPWGLWTACFHTNEFLKQSDVDEFAVSVKQHAPMIISLEEALKAYPVRNYGLLDKLFVLAWENLFVVRRLIYRLRKKH